MYMENSIKFPQYAGMNKKQLGQTLDRLQRQKEYLMYRDGQIFQSEYSIDAEIDYIISLL